MNQEFASFLSVECSMSLFRVLCEIKKVGEMNPGLTAQALAAKAHYQASNPKAKNITIRRIMGPQFHVHGGEFCDENGYLRDGSRACLAMLDNADAIFEFDYFATSKYSWHTNWTALVGVLNHVPSVWAD